MTTVIFRGPLPPEGGEFCSMCAMYWKAMVLPVIKDMVHELETDGKTGIKQINLADHAPKGLPEPAESVTVALVNGNPQLGALKVCWTHMMNISIATEPASGLATVKGGDVDTLAGMGLIPAAPGKHG